MNFDSVTELREIKNIDLRLLFSCKHFIQIKVRLLVAFGARHEAFSDFTYIFVKLV